MADSFLILAQAGAAGSPLGTLGFLVLLFAIMYFVMIRPQQKQIRQHQDLLAGLKKGDEVITQGGLIGRIHLITERTVTLEVASGVRIRVLKRAITAKGAVDEPPAKADEKKEEK